jgi:hypothetical protein
MDRWLLKMTHYADRQLFHQRGHKQEDPLGFLSRHLRYIQVLGLADDGSACKVTELLRTAPPAWKSILDLTNLATLLKTAAYQLKQLVELLQAGQRSAANMLDDNLIRRLTSLGFACGDAKSRASSKGVHHCPNQSACAQLTIMDGSGSAPASSTFIMELDEETKDGALPADNSSSNKEYDAHEDVLKLLTPVS